MTETTISCAAPSPTSTEMSLTRILAELKTLDKRIQEKAAGGLMFIACQRGTGDNAQLLISANNGTNNVIAVSSPTPATVEQTIRTDYQALVSLIDRQVKLKSALIAANAVTKVVVGGKTMTIAEAIERKRFIAYRKTIVRSMKEQHVGLSAFIDRENTNMNTRIDQTLAQAKANDKDISQSEQDTLTASIKTRQVIKSIDPLNLAEVIKSMEQEISDFETNVDFALSEVNALTKVAIPD